MSAGFDRGHDEREPVGRERHRLPDEALPEEALCVERRRGREDVCRCAVADLRLERVPEPAKLYRCAESNERKTSVSDAAA